MNQTIRMVGFDADDTLWKSEDYYREAEAEFRRIVGEHVDLDDVGARLYAVESSLLHRLQISGSPPPGLSYSMRALCPNFSHNHRANLSRHV